MNFGLLKRDIRNIVQAASQFPEIQEVLVFGSRAKNTFQKGSDVDLAIKGKGVNAETANRLRSQLNEERPLPYFFDVVSYDDITNRELREHIDRVGQRIFDARSAGTYTSNQG